jgi:lysophospholipase L1-like esterase
MRKRFLPAQVWPALAIGVALSFRLFSQTTAETKAAPEAKWEKDILSFEAADRTNPPPKDAVLFIGSSSIRLWTNLAQTFPGHKVINRGFGGSEVSDSVAFVPRIVTPYRPKLVLLYAGDNDIAAGKSAERVLSDFKAFVERIHATLPQTRIAYIAIKPCPAREKYLDQVKAANSLIQAYASSDNRLLFLDVFTPMLTKAGRPRADLFIRDGLHPNPQCYELWASVIRPILDRYDGPGQRGQQP